MCFVFTVGFAQSEDLARNYLDQGDYEKAASIFGNLHKKNPGQQNWLLGYVETFGNVFENALFFNVEMLFKSPDVLCLYRGLWTK